MRLWSRFEAKGYISSLTLSECSLFLLYRIAQVKLSHLNNSNQHNTTRLINPNLPLGTPTYGLVFLHQEIQHACQWHARVRPRSSMHPTVVIDMLTRLTVNHPFHGIVSHREFF